jgi:hypothetical protein
MNRNSGPSVLARPAQKKQKLAPTLQPPPQMVLLKTTPVDFHSCKSQNSALLKRFINTAPASLNLSPAIVSQTLYAKKQTCKHDKPKKPK